MSELVVLIGPPLGLLALGVAGCAWLAAGRRRQQAAVAALRPRPQMGPSPDSGVGTIGGRSAASGSATERSRT